MNWKCPSIGHMMRSTEFFPELASLFKGVTFSLLNGENSIRGDLSSQLEGGCQATNKSSPFLTDEDILHISSFAWNLITLECWLGSSCDPLQWQGISYNSPSPQPRTKVQFRRNLNWQFEVDYFGTWNIHFTTISVKYRYSAGNTVFSWKLLEITTFVFLHVSPSLLSPAQDSTVESVPNCWNGSTES